MDFNVLWEWGIPVRAPSNRLNLLYSKTDTHEELSSFWKENAPYCTCSYQMYKLQESLQTKVM